MTRTQESAARDAAHSDAPRISRVAAVRSALPEVGRFAALTAVSVVALSCIFPPLGIWPLAFVCLVPWTVATCRTYRAGVVHWGSFLAGWIFFLMNLAWLQPVTGLGYVALGFYLAIYWTLAAWAIRTGRAGIGPTWTLPVAWVACEYFRGWVMSGFPWLFLGHAFYTKLSFIQISDLTGAYGVSFLVAMANGLLAEAILVWRPPLGEARPRRRGLAIAAVATVAALGGSLVYGRYRINQAEFSEGPLIAVIQEDFPLRSQPPYGDHPYVVFARYIALAAQAAAENPDLIVFPETVWQGSQNIQFLEVERQAVDDVFAGAWSYGKHAHDATSAFARGEYEMVNRVLAHMERSVSQDIRNHFPGGQFPRLPPEGGPPVTVVLGSISIEVLPGEAYPKHKRFNSAMVYDPDGVQRTERYDKKHLVPFGESVPFRNQRVFGVSLHPLYRLLNSLSPFSSGGKVEYSLWPGDRFTTFEFDAGDRVSRFGVPICYEDVMPYICRRFVWHDGERRVDFLLNISNDGWFQHSAELEQHLAICVFRAIENRVSIARAVNTGISGFIDPDGRRYSLVERDGRLVGPGVIGFSIDRPKIDSRSTLYGQIGDTFARICMLFAVALWTGGIFTRWVNGIRQHRRRKAQPEAQT